MSISGGNIRNIRYPAPTGYPDPVFQVRIYPLSGSGKKSVSGKTLIYRLIPISSVDEKETKRKITLIIIFKVSCVK